MLVFVPFRRRVQLSEPLSEIVLARIRIVFVDVERQIGKPLRQPLVVIQYHIVQLVPSLHASFTFEVEVRAPHSLLEW